MPGAYSSIPTWWSREQWRSDLLADLQSDDVTELRTGVGTRGPVSVRAIYAVAVAISAAADGATGRNAMPGNAALAGRPIPADEPDLTALARLGTNSGYGLTTVQKAVRVLHRRGWLVLVRNGKNRLTSAERKELWCAGSKARRRRNVWACTMPKRRLPVDNSVAAEAPSVGGCALPTTRRVVWVPPVGLDKNFKPTSSTRNGAPRRATTANKPQTRSYRCDPRALQLATDMRTRIPWLQRVPYQRIVPALHRFAVAGWSARALQRHLDRLLSERGWTVPGTPALTERDQFGNIRHRPATTLCSPWGYLAFLLRHLDPTDLIAEQRHEAALAEVDRYKLQLIFGTPCVHGQPAGNIASPNRAVLACPTCRRSRKSGPS